MISDSQKAKLLTKLKDYRRRYLVDKYKELDESGTRIMVNNLLIGVLGYKELEEVKTEYTIKGTYADYVVQVGRKKHFIVEVKAIQIDLSEHHLRQAVNYAANEGIDWVLLTNGRCYELYRVIFGKPITNRKVFSFDLLDQEQMKQSVDCFVSLTRKAALSDHLEKFWKRFQALAPNNLARHLYAIEVVRFLRKRLKKEAKLLFPEEDIYDSLHQVVVNKIEIQKPSFSSVKKKKILKKVTEQPPHVQVEHVPSVLEKSQDSRSPYNCKEDVLKCLGKLAAEVSQSPQAQPSQVEDEPDFFRVPPIFLKEKLPDSIDDVPNDILNWAVECEATKRPFKIIRQELDFYQKMRLSVPHFHPDERHKRRMALRNPRKLWTRSCMKCGKEMETTYSPERSEIVYCEECYLKEVY